MAFSSSLQKSQIPVVCQLCEEDSKIQYKCKDCNLLMCRKCKEKTHTKFKNAADHRIIDIKEIGTTGEEEDISFSDVKCQEHESQPCDVYCKTCNQPICFKCVTKTHNGHTFMDEVEFISKRQTLREKREELEQSYEFLIQKEKKITEIEGHENSKYVKAREDILSQKAAIEKNVNEEADKLMKELDHKWKSIDDSIKMELIRIDKMKKEMKKQNIVLKDATASEDFKQFLKEFDKLSTTVKVDETPEMPTIPTISVFIPADIRQGLVGKFQNVKRAIDETVRTEVKVCRQFDTDLKNIHCMAACAYGSLWIGDHLKQRMQHVRITDKNIQTISNFNTNVYDMAVTSSGDILLSVDETSLKQIRKNQSEIIGTKYSVSPLLTKGIHVTSNKKVIISARSLGPPFPRSGRRVVIVMDQEGKPIKEYEYKNNKPLFTLPRFVTSTSNGNICVVDWLDNTGRGQVVILNQGGDVISVYTGHQDINKDEPFSPCGILTSQSDNIIIADLDNHCLHILNSSGHFIKYFKTDDMGIRYPHSLLILGSDKLYIGCVSDIRSPDTFKSKLYEMTFSGF